MGFANCTLLHVTDAREHNYPTGEDWSPGEWQTEKGAPRGFPGRTLLLSGFATNRHTLLYLGPRGDMLLSAV